MIFVLLIFPYSVFGKAGEGEILTVHLPREVGVGGQDVLLGQAAVVFGPEAMSLAASGVALGRFTSPGQVIRVDRGTILSRLTSVGIDAGKVRFSGADFVDVRREALYFEGRRFSDAARRGLEKEFSGDGGRVELLSQPESMVLTEPNVPVELRAMGSRCQNPGSGRITVAAYQGGSEIGRREVSFAVRYKVKRAVAASDIQAGAVLGAKQFRIEELESNRPGDGSAANLTGLTAKRLIRKGAIINPEWVGTAESAVIVKRRQQVLLKIDRGALYITASGESMDEGKVGDVIRVRRSEGPQERIVRGTILSDGTVEPLI
jgi:flagella basal body P-ring formation protein FlgA